MDKKTNLHGAGTLDDLLLDLVLEKEKHIPEIQKTIDMTAHALFQNTATVALPAAAKNEFISQFPAFKESWWTRMNIFRLFVGTMATLAVLLYFVALNKPESKPPTSSSALPLVSQSDKDEREPIPEKLETKEAGLTMLPNISFENEKPVARKDSFTHIEVPDKTNFNRKKSRPIHINPNGNQRYWEKETEENNPFISDGVKIKTNDFEPMLTKYTMIYRQLKPIAVRSEKRKIEINQKVHGMLKDVSENKKEPVILDGIYKRKALDGRSEESKRRKVTYASHSCFVYSGEPFDDMFKHMVFFSDENHIKELPYKEKSPSQWAKGNHLQIPKAMRFWDIAQKDAEGVYRLNVEKAEKTFLKPFYISKAEVRNIDYQEFLHYIKKQNGFEEMKLYLQEKEIPEEAFIYEFHNTKNEYVQTTGRTTINILPKKDVWTDDFYYSYNSPMDQAYLLHPAYREYPVVGVSYWQALAYLDWLTWIWQSRCDAQNIPYDLEFDLPYDYERESAALRYLVENERHNLGVDAHADFLCNLGVSYFKDYELRRQLNLYSPHQYMNSIYSHPVGRVTIPIENKSSFHGLDGNVSEWCKESYTENYEPWRKEYRELLAKDSTMASKLLLDLEAYFHSTCNDTNGKLVRGANWGDRRIRPDAIRLHDAIWAKAFIDPNRQHCTLGFRYVLRVKLKNEDAIKMKVKTLGRNMKKLDYSKLDKLPKQLWTFPIEISREHLQQEKEKGNRIVMPLNENRVNWDLSAMVTETTNLAWLFFLNYLIDENRIDDLNKCIPADADWAYKMSTETEPETNIQDNVDFIDLLPFPESFYKMNNISPKKFERTVFAGQPVVNISHGAAQLYCDWLTEIYGHLPDMQEKHFRLPSESEWEVVARNNDTTSAYAWDGPYLRDYKGCYMANFNWSTPYDNVTFAKSDDYSQAKQMIEKEREKFNITDSISLYDSLFNKEIEYNDFLKTQNTERACATNWSDKPELYQCARYAPSEYGLYDVCGNASEMLDTPDKTKGGSYTSPGYFLQLKNHEKWDGKPSPCVGFRVFVGEK